MVFPAFGLKEPDAIVLDAGAVLGTREHRLVANLISIDIVGPDGTGAKTCRKASGGLSRRALRLSLERLSSESTEDVSLAALAKAAGLSRFHFCRAFKKSTGLTPHEWLRQRRMNQATELLRDRTVQITDIAGMLGYATLTAFGVAFKRHTGLTPGEWRRAVA